MAEAAQAQPQSQPQPQDPAAKPEKEKKVKVKKEKKEKKARAPKVSNDISLPILVEFTYTTAVIIMMVLFLAVIGVSVFTGATLVDTLIRTTVTMVLVGSLLLILTRMVSRNALDESIVEFKKLVEEEEEKRKAELEKSAQESLEIEPLDDEHRPAAEFVPGRNKLSEFDFEMMDVDQSAQAESSDMPVSADGLVPSEVS